MLFIRLVWKLVVVVSFEFLKFEMFLNFCGIVDYFLYYVEDLLYCFFDFEYYVVCMEF